MITKNVSFLSYDLAGIFSTEKNNAAKNKLVFRSVNVTRKAGGFNANKVVLQRKLFLSEEGII